MSIEAHLLEAVGLTRRYREGGRHVAAVRDVTLALRAGETLALVGESGAGKSTLARMLLALEPIDAGVVRWEGVPVGHLHGRALRRARRRFQPVFQNPHSSLNPRLDVLETLGEVVRQHEPLRGARLVARVQSLLNDVGLSPRFALRRPAELSGGEAQRVALARALAVRPRALVLDEPFSALDPLTTAALVNRLLAWQRSAGVALLFITHDLGVVGHLADRIAVMHDGRIVESDDARRVLEAPRHEHTRELLAAVPGRRLFSRSESRAPVALEGR